MNRRTLREILAVLWFFWFVTFLLLLVTCGSRTQVADIDMHELGALPQTAGGAPGGDMAGASGTCERIGICSPEFHGSCPERDVCACTSCGCKEEACMKSEACLSIYTCMTLTNCYDLLECIFQCGSFITGHEAFLSMAQALYLCVDGRCPRCMRPAFDAGPQCPLLRPPVGPLLCPTTEGGGGPGVCEAACHDDSTEYDWHCTNGSCSCVFDSKEICRCQYPVADGCHTCCPFWGEKAQR